MSKSNKKTPHKHISKSLLEVNSYNLKSNHNLALSLAFEYSITYKK